MSQRLFPRFMTLIAIPALVFGFWLWFSFFWGSGAWIHAKTDPLWPRSARTIGIVMCCSNALKPDKTLHSHVWYRWFNEAPVILMLAIVALAVIKPF